MKTSELKKMLKESGCYKIEEGGNHEKWYSPITGRKFTVGRHSSQEVKKGTAESILKQAGIK